ncbi:hypothetical protein B0T09DRAFT_378448 [Sordaria sp. MPI-SDFR-AT-0083]|nr:hypothetical protein B0T09DRAFT_378448 [Sordaria sp. MPI-SDFR-AT-0083]
MANIPLKITQDPFIPLNSLILLTGINGLIGSHIANQLLSAGYRVRGTVRSKSRCTWVKPFFASRHGANRLELIEVPNFTIPRIWKAHRRFKAVNEDLKILYGLLHASRTAAGSNTVKAFIYTSSSWAAYKPKAVVAARMMTEESWNHEAVVLAEDSIIPDAEKGLAPFMAIRVKVEEAMWDWSASTARLVRDLYDGKQKEVLDFIPILGPAWAIDARDAGRLYLGVLVSGLTGSRVFGSAGRFNWKLPLDIFKDLYPKRKDWMELPGSYQYEESEIQADIPLLLLGAVGQEGWTSLKDSLQDAVERFGSTGKS